MSSEALENFGKCEHKYLIKDGLIEHLIPFEQTSLRVLHSDRLLENKLIQLRTKVYYLLDQI